MDKELSPFGASHFEEEIQILGDNWDDYFFEHTRFVQLALDRNRYLIVGRRGSGKSSLTEYFRYQNKYRNATIIKFGKAQDYYAYFSQIANKLDFSKELIVQQISKLWRYIIGRIIIEHFEIPYESSINITSLKENKPSTVLNEILRKIKKYCSKDNSIDISKLVTQEVEEKVEGAITQALALNKGKHLFLIFDSREKYDISNEKEMSITAALIQAGYSINSKYSFSGIHIKICVSAEIFPYLTEEFVTNPAKFVKDPLFLHWRPKDLIRLVCWRYFKYLNKHNYINESEYDIDWEDYKDIYTKIWLRFFPEFVINRRGIQERTLPYILRHTQLRPRQLVTICNTIADLSKNSKLFPFFDENSIKQGIYNSELPLASDLLSSYSSIYENIGDILEALEGEPIEFLGGHIDKIAHRSAAAWTKKRYSSLNFKRMMIELGIIGRSRTEVDENTRIVEADFEFAMEDRLYITEKNLVAIHPMFYRKLNITKRDEEHKCVYPFPDHPDFKMLRE